MLSNRFSTQSIILVVAATALTTLVAVNAYLVQRRGEGIAVDLPQNAQAVDQSVNPDTYYPLPPGKQTALMNAARRAYLHPGHGVQTEAVANPETYYPLPPGKQTILINAAIQACIDDYLSKQADK